MCVWPAKTAMVALAVTLQHLREPCKLLLGSGFRRIVAAKHRRTVQPDKRRPVVGEGETVIAERSEIPADGFGVVIGNIMIARKMENGYRRIHPCDVLKICLPLIGILVALDQVARHDHERRLQRVDLCDRRFQVSDRPLPVLAFGAEPQLRVRNLHEGKRILFRSPRLDCGLCPGPCQRHSERKQ